MTLTMAFIGMFLIGMSGFFLGQYQARCTERNKTKSLYSVDKVVHALQVKLSTDKDRRGFQTRTHVSMWLKNTAQEVKEDLEHGRKTR